MIELVYVTSDECLLNVPIERMYRISHKNLYHCH